MREAVERARLGARRASGSAAARPALAGALSHGDKRKLELAMLLAGDPRVILLDEPMAGVSAEDMPGARRGDPARSSSEEGKTVLMVEHHIDVVTGVAERIAVMHHGALLACDTPDGDHGERGRSRRRTSGSRCERGVAAAARGARTSTSTSGQSHVLQGVSFDVPQGGVTALLGRNGVGKTTTLRALLGLVRPRGRGRARRRGARRGCRRTGSSAAASATCPRTATSSPG